MDDFVQKKLIEWGLSEWVERFKDQQMTKESLFGLNEPDIAELIPKIGKRSIFRMRLNQLKKEETDDFSAEALPCTTPKRKRELDLQGESSKGQPPTKAQRDSETRILADVKDIMTNVSESLHGQDKLSTFLKKKIRDLETEKRELVGVFGRSGAGKSSLINAILIEKDLLPSGSVSACTSVMIQVEANTCSSKYEADIDFIKKEEWENELWSLNTLKEADDDYRDMDKKLSDLYGEEWKNKTNLMEEKYFKNIPEFLESKKKSLKYDTAKELSVELLKYTKAGSKHGDGNKAQQWYWPLVKCVTVRVPSNDFLQHVTLIDLPGNGDRNKSRDEMWKQIVRDCSTVWIVAEINRAASEKEAWEILESACGLIGNGGQCQQIYFICTKSDPSDNRVTRNREAKEGVKEEFQKLNKISKHFSKDCFKVFTVSAEEFLKRKCVEEDDNGIPKLQHFLQNLNDCHSETFIYVSGAYGILSLIEGARRRKGAVKKADDVCTVLEKNMNEQLNQVKTAVEKATETFEQCLGEGVKNYKTSEDELKSFLNPNEQRGFFKTLQAVVKKGGIHTTAQGEQINLNTMLASCLTNSIDEKFRQTFPNDVKGGSFNGVINALSLGTCSLIQKYKDVELQLTFLNTEEENLKAKLNKFILKEKKKIYISLTETIKENMKKGYEDAAEFTGEGALKNMRETIERHVDSHKKMYEEAKNTMLKKMNALKKTILCYLEKTMKESIEFSLKTDAYSLPDVSEHLESVKKHFDELKDEEMSRQ